MAQGIAARVCSVCLAPGPLLALAYARQVALRVVGPVGGGLYKWQFHCRCFVLIAHDRREALPPTQLGVACALLKGGAKEISPGCPYLTKKRKCDKGRLYHW